MNTFPLPEAANQLGTIRRTHPLIHNITNFVVMNTTANALLAVGASPVMAHAPEEMPEITGKSAALVLNIGTLDRLWVHCMHEALTVAIQKNIPVVIDPVGAGASRLRSETAHALLARATGCILRGNASEILALATATTGGKGVDSTDDAKESITAGLNLAQQYKCVVCISGEQDYILSPQGQVAQVAGGSALMPCITGMGCSATALMAAFASAAPSSFSAALSTMIVMATAGSMAAHHATGPGTFLPHFFDALYTMQKDDIERHACVQTEQ